MTGLSRVLESFEPRRDAATYPEPTTWGTMVCCHCKRQVVERLFCCDGNWIEAWSCPDCGDVIPVLSAVCNAPDWSAA